MPLNSMSPLLAFFVALIFLNASTAALRQHEHQRRRLVVLGKFKDPQSHIIGRPLITPTLVSKRAGVINDVIPLGGQQLQAKGAHQNLADRVTAAVALLGASFLLVHYAGKNGLIALVFVLQWSMFYETCKVIEDHYLATSGIQTLKRQTFQKWWWFATIVFATSFRSLMVTQAQYSDRLGIFVHPHFVDLTAYVMTVIGLVNGVVGMAIHRAAGPDMFRIHLAKMAAYHFALLYLVTQSAFWIMTIQEYGMRWIIYPSILVIVNDSMAYFFGVLMGSRKLLPRLSPKKTVEGFIGAGFSTMLIAIPLLKLVMKGESSPPNARHAIILALFVSLVAPFGGFLASAVKRAFDSKDFGTLIPGHGGVLDRIDCHVVTAPFVYLYLRTFL